MRSVLTVLLPKWMMDEDLKRVMAVLGEGNALLVGGCVRNMILDILVVDIDISTKITPDNVIKLLSAAGIRAVPTGVRFGTVTAVTNCRSYEITTLRRDIQTDGRHAVVSYTNNWAEDAARRDFTINALYADCQGHIYDPLGTGIDDLKKGIVRFIGDPYKRINEDYLRILRYFRFIARYGREKIDQPSFVACRERQGKISDLSAERVTEEMYKILSDDSAPIAVDYMAQAGLFDDCLLQDQADHLRQLIALQEYHGRDDNDARFYLIFGNAKNKLFNLSNKIKIFFDNLDHILSGDMAMALCLYRYGRRAAVQGMMIALVRGDSDSSDGNDDIARILQTDIPVFPVDGAMVMREFNLSEGRQVGEILRSIEVLWIKNNFQGEADDLMNKLKNNI